METKNNIEKSKNTVENKKPKRNYAKFFKILFVILTVFVLLGLIANKEWIDSGSNKWEKVLEKDGVVVYSLKKPGEFVLQMKATKTIKSKLAAFVSIMQDIEAMCTHGCYDAKIITKDSPQLLSTFTRFDLPFPFKDREWVLENDFSQDSITKEIIYKIHAVPHVVPENEDYVRINHFKNMWRFIPKENGNVEVVWQADMDQEGYMINLLTNLGIAEAMHDSFLEVEEMIQDEKYQTATYDFVKEVDDNIIEKNN